MFGSHNHNFRNFFFFPNQAAKAVLHKQVLHTKHDAVVWSDPFQNNSLHQHFRKTSTFPHSFKCLLKFLMERKTNLVQSPNDGLFFWTGPFEICLGLEFKAHCYSDHSFGSVLGKKTTQKWLNIFQYYVKMFNSVILTRFSCLSRSLTSSPWMKLRSSASRLSSESLHSPSRLTKTVPPATRTWTWDWEIVTWLRISRSEVHGNGPFKSKNMLVMHPKCTAMIEHWDVSCSCSHQTPCVLVLLWCLFGRAKNFREAQSQITLLLACNLGAEYAMNISEIAKG